MRPLSSAGLILWALCGLVTCCTVTVQGEKDNILLKGTVLLEKGPLVDGYVLVQSGKISHVGHGGFWLGSEALNATFVDCTDSVISPGFINLHEHIDYGATKPFPNTGIKYNSRQNWRVGNQGFSMLEADINGSSIDASKWGELRHIFSGTTSLVGGDMATGLTRNLDFASGLELDRLRPDVEWAVFPLDDEDGMLRNGDCDYGSDPITQETFAKYNRYLAHIGEGISPQARNEFKCLSSQTFDTIPMVGGGGLSADIIAPNLGILHGVALTEKDFDLVAERGAQVVWSPRSNVFLYGHTLNVSYLLDAGINVALGTDWLPSGSATMTREAMCATYVSQKSFGYHLEPKTIWKMMTGNAAKVASFGGLIGSIEVGKLADIAVFSGFNSDPYAQAVFAAGKNVDLVMRGGKIILMNAKANYLAGDECEHIKVGESAKIVCVSDALNTTYAEFAAEMEGKYPVIIPSIPPNEPSCEPSS